MNFYVGAIYKSPRRKRHRIPLIPHASKQNLHLIVEHIMAKISYATTCYFLCNFVVENAQGKVLSAARKTRGKMDGAGILSLVREEIIYSP